MTLKRCRECGSPVMLARGYEWPGNGTIISRNDPSSRLAFFEAGYYPYVWSEFEDRLGFSVSGTALKSQRLGMQEYLASNIIYGWRRYALKTLSLKAVIGHLIDQVALFGFGHLELADYRRHKLLVMRMRNPFDIISIVDGMRGFFEIMEGTGSEVAWKRDGGEYVVTLIPGPRQEEKEERAEALRELRQAKHDIAGGPIPCEETAIEYCPSCGLPLGLTDLVWEENEGAVRIRQRGTRFVMSTGYIFLGIIRELEKRSGRDLESVVVEISRDFHRDILKGVPIRTRGGAYRAATRYLSVGGFGEIVDSTYGEGHLEMTIINPFYPPRVVGRIAGLFEYVEGQEANINYRSPENQVLELELTTS
ncbi:MAG: hypothetical protein ACOC78_02130 [Actinomycetota bacterium]